MKPCKGMNRSCALESGHKGKCVRLTVVNAPVVNSPVVNKSAVESCDTDDKYTSKVAEQDDGPERPARQIEWQRKNKDRYNAKMREFMKDYRKRKRAKPLVIAHG